MPFTAGFWNINMGINSTANRRKVFSAWCAQVQPDLLMLEEVGNTLDAEILAKLTGMEPIGYVNTLDKNYHETGKQIWALQKKGAGFDARALHFPRLDQKRLLLKVTNPAIRGFQLWGIHANASTRGGREATTKVNEFLATPAGAGAIVGGDFNYPIEDAGALAKAPLSWQNTPLNFTQWNKVQGSTRGPDPDLHITQAVLIYQKIEPHNVIDYVIVGPDRTAVASPDIPDEESWLWVLREFDHCPVLYDIA